MSREITTTKIAIFQKKEIRKIIYKNEWWFSVIDVCGVLTGSIDAGAYWRKLKQRLKDESNEVVTFYHGLKLLSSDGKMREAVKKFQQIKIIFQKQRTKKGWNKIKENKKDVDNWT